MTAPVREGDVLAGKYRVERILGEGGMGVVVRAHHVQLDQRVALKFLLPAALGSDDATERFAREARAAAKIKSEHVARVIDVGVLESGAPYMVMEYLEGADLATVASQRGKLAVADVVRYALEACEALAEAHAAGIVHRDLKPANLFLARQPDGGEIVKVLDFGVSKNIAPTESNPEAALTKTASVVGSLLYMPPEQMRSARDVDARADIWGLGATMFQLLAGVAPFSADSLAGIVDAVRKDAPKPLGTLRPDVPPGLVAVLMRCLEKSPDQRWPDVGELAYALAAFAPEDAKRSAEKVAGVLLAAQRTVVTNPPPARATYASSGSGGSSDDAFAATESADASGDRSAGSAKSPGETSRATSAWAKSGAKRTMPPRAVRWTVGAAALALVSVIGVALWKLGPTRANDATIVDSSSAAGSVSVIEAPSASAPASALASALASASASALAPASASASSSTTPHAPPHHRPPPSPSASASSSPAPSSTNPLDIKLK